MYDDEPMQAESIYAQPAEDKRIELMRQFVALSDDLDRMRAQQRDLDEKQSAVSKERERVRRDLDGIINPSEKVGPAPSEYR